MAAIDTGGHDEVERERERGSSSRPLVIVYKGERGEQRGWRRIFDDDDAAEESTFEHGFEDE